MKYGVTVVGLHERLPELADGPWSGGDSLSQRCLLLRFKTQEYLWLIMIHLASISKDRICISEDHVYVSWTKTDDLFNSVILRWSVPHANG